MKKNGRPTIYTEELVTRICERLANGESLRKICRDNEMPDRKTVYLWLLDPKKESFFHQYTRACDIRADELFDELEEIAYNEDKDVARAKLIVDTRKWYLSKVMPKKFGDKMDYTSDGKPIPLLNAILNHNSDKEDSESK